MEIEFYANSLEEAKSQMLKTSSPAQPLQGPEASAEAEKLKAKLRQMQRREAELQEEIERLKKAQQDEKAA